MNDPFTHLRELPFVRENFAKILTDDTEDYDHADNFRIARRGILVEEEAYNRARDHGCCGSYDTEVVDPAEQVWQLGFNYGH